MFRLAVILVISLAISLANTLPNDDDGDVDEALVSVAPANAEGPPFFRFGAIKAKFDPEDPTWVKDLHEAYEDEPPLPVAFDSRKKWTRCSEIGSIFSQNDCGVCWAAAAAGVIRDRICIKSSTHQLQISVNELMNCIPEENKNACGGREPIRAFQYYSARSKGVVTGGSFGSNVGCKPYAIDPNWKIGNKSVPMVCPAHCNNTLYPVPYAKDKQFGVDPKQINPNGKNVTKDILVELFHNGPVVATFTVYDSFIDFWDNQPLDAVYRHSKGEKIIGHHAIRLVGWGSSPDGTPYWTFLNSWGERHKHTGEGRFLRGTNECGIESDVSFVTAL